MILKNIYKRFSFFYNLYIYINNIMNEINVNVQDSPFVKTNTINKVIIRIANIELFSNVTVIASLFDNNTLVDNKVFKIEGQEYTNWSNDDQYIVDLVLGKLGMSPAP